MAVITVLSLKGGVAKTVTTVGLAEYLASTGKRVLIIDTDHQCASSEILLGRVELADCERNKETFHDYLCSELLGTFDHEILKTITKKATGLRNVHTLDIIPGSIRLDDFIADFSSNYGDKKTDNFWNQACSFLRDLRDYLNAEYDYVFVDCPPGVPAQVKILLYMTDFLLTPSSPDRLALRGVLFLAERLKRLGLNKEILGLIWTIYHEDNPTQKLILRNVWEKRRRYAKKIPEPFINYIPFLPGFEAIMEKHHSFTSFENKYRELSDSFARLAKEVESRLEKKLNK